MDSRSLDSLISGGYSLQGPSNNGSDMGCAWECRDDFEGHQQGLFTERKCKCIFRITGTFWKQFWPPPPPSKKSAPKICHKMRGYGVKSLEIKGLSQRIWCTNRLLWHSRSDFYRIRTPTFYPYEPLLLGWGWSSICWPSSGVHKWFWRMFPRNKGTFGCSPRTKTGTRVRSDVPRNENRNKGTLAKTTLLRNHPFVPHWLLK